MTYRQLTEEERYTIAGHRRAGLNNVAIAKDLGRHRSTIWREVKRNSSKLDGGYRAERAQENTNGRRSRSRRNRRFEPWEWRLVRDLLAQQWSPEQISGRLREDGKVSVSHETIYQYIWRDKRRGGELYKELRLRPKKLRKRYGTYERRGRVAGKRHISERPAEVETREVVGHWECDTIVGCGSKDCVLTIVERKTGFGLIGKLADRSAGEMVRCMRMLISRARRFFKTMTSDNGTEFHDYAQVEKATKVTFYFATPYHSWERGTVENFNGLVRQYLTKRSSFAHIDQVDCDIIAHRLNTRPRKRLGYRTPKECLDDE